MTGHEGTAVVSGTCARYFGSDGTLCSTHNRRFASAEANRCEGTAAVSASSWRHAKTCDNERDGVSPCSCGLDSYREGTAAVSEDGLRAAVHDFLWAPKGDRDALANLMKAYDDAAAPPAPLDVERLVAFMRYHPSLKGKEGEWVDGWDAATRTLLDEAAPAAEDAP